MAKVGALLSLFCILALATIAHSTEAEFHVNGKVYCDPCRVEFETKLAYPLEGATVHLECRNVTTGVVTYSLEGKTDTNGQYKLTTHGDHGEEICEVRAIESPKEECKVPFKGVEKARIMLTQNSGMMGNERLANPLGFMTEHNHAGCREALDAIGFVPFDLEV